MAVGVIALIVLFGSLNFADLRRSILAANPWWMLVAFLFGLGTYVGAALHAEGVFEGDVAFSARRFSCRWQPLW